MSDMFFEPHERRALLFCVLMTAVCGVCLAGWLQYGLAASATRADELTTQAMEWLAQLVDSPLSQKRFAAFALFASVSEVLGFNVKDKIQVVPKDHIVTWWILLCALHSFLRLCENPQASELTAWAYMKEYCEDLDGLLLLIKMICEVLIVATAAMPAAVAFYFGALPMLYVHVAVTLFWRSPIMNRPWHVQFPSLLWLPLRPSFCAEMISHCFVLGILATVANIRIIDVITYLHGPSMYFVLELLQEFFELSIVTCWSSTTFWPDTHDVEIVPFVHFLCLHNVLPWRAQRMFYTLFKTYFEGRSNLEEQWAMVIGLQEMFAHIDSDKNRKISGKEFRDFCENNAGEFKVYVQKVQTAMQKWRRLIAEGHGQRIRVTEDLPMHVRNAPQSLAHLVGRTINMKGREGRVVNLDITGNMLVKFGDLPVIVPRFTKSVVFLTDASPPPAKKRRTDQTGAPQRHAIGNS